MTWYYKDKEFTSEDIGDYEGFVYIIEHIPTGKKYLGKKTLKSKVTRPPLKGKTRKRKIIKESNWKKYWGSSKYLAEMIEQEGQDSFKRTILSLHESRSMLNYGELCEQVVRDVLHATLSNGEREYVNENIDNVFYNSNTKPLTEFIVKDET